VSWNSPQRHIRSISWTAFSSIPPSDFFKPTVRLAVDVIEVPAAAPAFFGNIRPDFTRRNIEPLSKLMFLSHVSRTLHWFSIRLQFTPFIPKGRGFTNVCTFRSFWISTCIMNLSSLVRCLSPSWTDAYHHVLNVKFFPRETPPLVLWPDRPRQRLVTIKSTPAFHWTSTPPDFFRSLKNPGLSNCPIGRFWLIHFWVLAVLLNYLSDLLQFLEAWRV